MDGLSVPSHGLKILCGSANPRLGEEIARNLGVEMASSTVTRFADGEIFVRIDENIRGNDVFIIQPTNPPSDNIMELVLLIDAAKRASAARITCVMPYYGYSRQDRKDQPRVAIGAKVLANMIVTAGADRVVGLDFHQHQLQGFFDVPVDHLYAAPVFVSHFRKKDLGEPVIVAPDVGSAKMARGFAKRLNGSLAIIDKRRPKANVSEVVNVVGEVEGKHCILADDMIDTAGTVSEAARALKNLGALDVFVCATHALLSGPAVERLSNAPIKEVVVTDSIMISDEKRFPKLCVLSVGELLGKAVRYIHSEQSVSSLFE
ncbi:MAG: ribose-phosphate pyrophosphokinase [Gemmatimonadaceae bacterium]|nr:ribose-phosphate pyrophosphokinase [Gemmatimonadaceae bacterium]